MNKHRLTFSKQEEKTSIFIPSFSLLLLIFSSLNKMKEKLIYAIVFVKDQKLPSPSNEEIGVDNHE